MALGDVNGDGTPDIIMATGAGGLLSGTVRQKVPLGVSPARLAGETPSLRGCDTVC